MYICVVSLVMEQYAKIKSQHLGRILLYRIGDFYEMFYSDAEQVAQALNITLTSRKSTAIPMCGIPYRSLDQYIVKLVNKGFSVAVCEQIDSKDGDLMHREVVRVITKGTIVDSELLEDSKPNYIACISRDLKALAWADISTGHFRLMAGDQSLNQLHSIEPSEVLVQEALKEDLPSGTVQVVNNAIFSNATSSFKKRFKISSSQKDFYKLDKKVLGVCDALLTYLGEVEKGATALLATPTLVKQSEKMFIDRSAWKSLEIMNSASGNKKSTLFGVLNRTLTCGGTRLLRSFLREPLLERRKIEERLACIEFFLGNDDLTSQARDLMKSLPDIERILGRAHFRRTSPRELGELRHGLKSVTRLHLLCRDRVISFLPKSPSLHGDLIDTLTRNLKEENLPNSTRDGGFIAVGHDKRLDRLRKFTAEYREQIDDLEGKYQAKIPQIRLCHGVLIGFYLELPSSLAPDLSRKFLHRQNLKDKSRYVTEELMQLELRLVQTEQKALELESFLFDKLLNKIKEESIAILATMKAVSEIDLFSSWAVIAREFNYTKPVISEGINLKLINSSHPVLQRFVRFTPNDCEFDLCRIILITGPNMGGKSTFSRQVALITIMAQIGCFVPADVAEIGLVDRVFCRSGCKDDIVKGASSFMVEMNDLSKILKSATNKSLIALDEVGSATSPKEGTAILRASLEYICDLGCRCICATHYSELTCLSQNLKELKNWTTDRNHKVIEGSSSFSHAIDVAKIAGMPETVLDRARELLKG